MFVHETCQQVIILLFEKKNELKNQTHDRIQIGKEILTCMSIDKEGGYNNS